MATKPKQIPRTTQPEHGSYSEPNSSRFLYVKVTDISPTTNNPRKHNRQQIRAIATSISAFGFCAPILIDRDKQIVAGHGRFEAAKLLGYSHVPAVSLEHLDPHRACAYMLADNKLTDRSKWDDGKLAIHLKELSELALDFEIEATGFELAEIDLRVQSLDGSDVDAADEFNPAAGPATSQAGDIWMMGDHRLYCGSALETVSYERLLQSEKAAAVFADPPYNVRIDGHVSGNGAIRHRHTAFDTHFENRVRYEGKRFGRRLTDSRVRIPKLRPVGPENFASTEYHGRAAVRRCSSQFAYFSVREFVRLHCKLPTAVVIEPSLCRQSLQNGNIPGFSRRLSPIGALRLPIWESGDEVGRGKTPQFRPILAFPGEPDRTLECVAGAGGFEPPHGGIKIPCLTTWRRPNKPNGNRGTSARADFLRPRRSIEGVEPFQQPRARIRGESGLQLQHPMRWR
jgi:ParB-like chromosome segregation protein Spo0J